MLRKDTFLSGVIIGLAAFVTGSYLFKSINWLMINYFFNGSFAGVRPQFVYILGAVFCLIPFHILSRQNRLRSQQGLKQNDILILKAQKEFICSSEYYITKINKTKITILLLLPLRLTCRTLHHLLSQNHLGNHYKKHLQPIRHKHTNL